MIIENVEKLRKAMGVTKTHLAHKLGLTLQGYAHITTGNVRLDAERLKIIGMVFKVDPGIFFDEKLTESVIREIEGTNHISNIS
jgi:transcriptional regulator with XRE-family HTH domain